MGTKEYFVYILSSAGGTLYTGLTNNLARRTHEHQTSSSYTFTARYYVKRLIYFESTDSVYEAIARAKQIKAWSRRAKLELIRTMNPRFRDLTEEL